jgi:predicted nucleic acid-binding protein
MTRDYFDSSVLVAAIAKEEPNHRSCTDAWQGSDYRIFLLHGVLESFASLTGGKKPHLRLTGKSATTVLSGNLEDFQVEMVAFDVHETMALLADAQASGVRGGAVYDYLHLCAARKAGADRIFTLNKRHFMAIAPDLAPKIFHPADR